MGDYTRSDLRAMKHSRIKKLAIGKCRQTNQASSWVQSSKQDELIEFLIEGKKPSQTPPPTMPETTPTKNPYENPNPSPQPSASAGSLEDMLADKVAERLGDDIFKKTDGMRETFIKAVAEETEKMKTLVEDKMKDLQNPVYVKINDVEVKKTDGLKHKQFPFVLECLKHFKRVWLCGPSGTGKSYLIEQCANALGFEKEKGEYEYLKGTGGVTEAHMTGRMTFDGTFIDGAVARAFRNGTFLCLDEFDAFDANAGLVFNSVLDGQGILATPNDKDNPMVLKHDNFHVSVATNTWGDGTDFNYVGRGQIDMATLDRLQAVKVFVDYDKNIERALVGDFTDTADVLWNLRSRCKDEHVNKIVSTRLFLDGQKWRLAGKSNKQFLDIVTTGWTKEEMSKVNIKQILKESK